jgi:hypothetical protein
MDDKGDDTDHQDETIRLALESVGSVDFVVNNTGNQPDALPDRSPRPGRGPQGDRGDLRGLPVRGAEGLAVNVSLVTSVRPAPNIGWYGATKARLISIAELLAVELSAPTFA